MYIQKPEGKIKQIFDKAFPNYSGKKFQIEKATTVNCRSYWDSGSRSYYAIVKLNEDQSVFSSYVVRDQHPVFDQLIEGSDKVQITERNVVVQKRIFQGENLGLTLYVEECSELYPKDVSTIEAKLALDTDHYIVLAYTHEYKNSYGGKTNIRFKRAERDASIDHQRWEEAKQKLIDLKFLNKRGSITTKGKNVVSEMKIRSDQFRKLA